VAEDHAFVVVESFIVESGHRVSSDRFQAILFVAARGF